MIDATIRSLWNGEPAAEAEHVRISASIEERELRVRVQGPFHGDPKPAEPPGRSPGLWEHEVVELFLVGPAREYLEIELGPHGHYLALLLAAPRRVVRDDLEIRYQATRRRGRFQGDASVPVVYLPGPPERWNAFAIHGSGAARRCLAAHPLPGPRPDFHQIDRFPRLER